MVKKRSTAFLVLTLVCVSVLYVKIITEKVELASQFAPRFDLQLGRSLQDFPTIFPAVDSVKNCSGGTLIYKKYCVISPYKDEAKNIANTSVVTLCTQGTVEFLQHVVVLCHRWSAPISVAVYSPQEDYEDARIKVHLLRQCNSCVRLWVSWHFFGEQTEFPSIDQSKFPSNCSSINARKKPKKRKSQGIYPINVGRNVARRWSTTPYVMSIDIELYPSQDIPVKFERMLRSQAPKVTDRQVWVLPVFEVQYRFRAPLLKSDLRILYQNKKAISFHRYRCNICHRIPNLTQWMSLREEHRIISELEESLEPLRVWTTVKRSKAYKLHDWEPFFIGTTKDPEFDIRLSWEGKANKMQMAYEMCILDYDFHIIENAFLVHSPGVNFYNAKKEKERLAHQAQNRRVINLNKRNLVRKYGAFRRIDCG